MTVLLLYEIFSFKVDSQFFYGHLWCKSLTNSGIAYSMWCREAGVQIPNVH